MSPIVPFAFSFLFLHPSATLILPAYVLTKITVNMTATIRPLFSLNFRRLSLSDHWKTSEIQARPLLVERV